MTPGAEVNNVVFHEPDVRDNEYAIQVHTDLINGMLGSIGLNSDEVHPLPGTNPRNSKLFFMELNEEQVNTVVSQFGSTAMGIVTQWAIRLQTSDFYGPSLPTPNPPSPP